MLNKLPLSITAYSPANRCGIGVAATNTIELMRRVVDVRRVPQPTPGAAILYHHAMPGKQPPGWYGRSHVIGYWVCESSIAAPQYKATADALTQIWTCSEASASAIRALGTQTPVYVIPHPVQLPLFAPDRRGRDGVTTLFAFCPPVLRKGTLTLISLWKEAFAGKEKARLIIKVRNSNQSLTLLLQKEIGDDERIELISGDVSDAEMAALYARADIFASAHRAGAFELHLAEAAAHGLPVICTAVGGVLDYLDDTCAALVDGAVIFNMADDDMNKAGEWIEPDADAFIADLRELAADAELRHQLGQLARAKVAQLLSPDRITELMHAALTEMVDLPAKLAPPAPTHVFGGVPELPSLKTLRPGLEVMSQGHMIPGPKTPLVLSHRRSGTHLVGEFLTKHWGVPAWLKSHDWPERRPTACPAVYVLRNPIDALYATWTWWRTGGGAMNKSIAEVMDGITFVDWLQGKAGRSIGYQAWCDKDRDNCEVSRGMMYDPMRYWLDHWLAAQRAGIPVLLYERLVTDPQMEHDVISNALGREAQTPLAVMQEDVGLSPDSERSIGYALPHWDGWVMTQLYALLAVHQDLMASVGVPDLQAWINIGKEA